MFTPLKDPAAILSPEDVESIIDHAYGPRDKLLVRLLWRTGCRISELLSLRRERIDWTRGTATLQKLKSKGESWRVVPLDEESLDKLRAYLKTFASPWVFPGLKGHLSYYTAYTIIREAAERAGITEVGDSAISRYRRPSPHKLRHAFIAHAVSQLGDSFESLRTVQVLVGHSNIQTTASYVNVSSGQLRETYNRIFAK